MHKRVALLAAAFFAAVVHAVPAFGQSAPGSTFRDCAECPEMVVVPGGRFLMGAAPGEEEREGVPAQFRGRSQPRVAVTIGTFALGRYEVTRGEFAAFVADTGHAVEGGCYFYNDEGKWALDPRLNWRNPGFAQSARHPVVCVSWNDAQAYVAWLRRKTGKNYRLPSEAEWEFAARAGSQAARPWGNAADDACDHANVGDKTYNPDSPNAHQCRDGHKYTAPSGRQAPSFRRARQANFDLDKVLDMF